MEYSKKSARIPEVDFLKGFSALTVILIHVLDRYRAIESLSQVWVALHFAVGIFVFSSGFLYPIALFEFNSLSQAARWLVKRCMRLVTPYYSYVIIHASLILAFPLFFDGADLDFSTRYFMRTLLLLGGFGSSSVPKLFILIAIFIVVSTSIIKLFRSIRVARYFPFVISIMLSSALLLIPSKIAESVVSYLQVCTWISLFYIGMYIYEQRENVSFLVRSAFASGLLTLLLSILLTRLGLTTSIFHHEYPPTLFYILYTTFWALALFLIYRTFILKTAISRQITSCFTFLSRHSYTIFFTHLIFLDLFDKPTGSWLLDYCFIGLSTIATIFILEVARNKLSRKSDI